MTNKMEKIVKTYEEKMHLIVFTLNLGIINKDKALNDIKVEYKKFEDLRSNMFSYGLISINDFTETTFVGCEVWDRCLQKIYN